MNDTSFKEIHCESALNELKRKVPFGWDLNIYRGCSHACQYCYAIYSHQYLNSDGFYDDIHVKNQHRRETGTGIKLSKMETGSGQTLVE